VPSLSRGDNLIKKKRKESGRGPDSGIGGAVENGGKHAILGWGKKKKELKKRKERGISGGWMAAQGGGGGTEGFFEPDQKLTTKYWLAQRKKKGGGSMEKVSRGFSHQFAGERFKGEEAHREGQK